MSNDLSAAVSMLMCPLCGASLTVGGKSLYCGGERRHCYDIASSGYVNLLPPGKMNNAKTGDDGTMIAARRAFLSGGYYDSISDTAAKIAADYSKNSVSFVDAGCGEGYHTCRIASALCKQGTDACGIGLDASKKGAEIAAKRAGRTGANVFFAAANIFSMPVRNGGANVIFSMFAPIPGDEALRVLDDSGIIVVVSSGKRHLWEMREVLYGTPRENDAEVSVPDGFRISAHEELSFNINLPDNGAIMNLFAMTPFYYRSPSEGRAKLSGTKALNVCVQAEYTVLKKA